jgi:glycosyltransferase involved in cell wall biosynthesis
MKVSIIIPVYNEEGVLPLTHKRVVASCEHLMHVHLADDYEILYVDDGSRDSTLNILKSLAHESTRCRIVSFSRNFGHQAALIAGILRASGDAAITLDADMQDPPELMGEMIRKFLSGNDIVYAVRKSRPSDSFLKKWSARLFYRAMHLMGAKIVHDHADYRLFSDKVIREFRRMGEVNMFLRGIFPFMGFRHDFVYYERQQRASGETKYPVKKMLAFAWEGITSFSSFPLRIASFTGLLIFLGSLCLVVWAFTVKLMGKTIPGWASLAIPLFFIGGLNILFLGIIGEYVGKIYSEVKRRPRFIINETINFPSGKPDVRKENLQEHDSCSMPAD